MSTARSETHNHTHCRWCPRGRGRPPALQAHASRSGTQTPWPGQSRPSAGADPPPCSFLLQECAPTRRRCVHDTEEGASVHEAHQRGVRVHDYTCCRRPLTHRTSTRLQLVKSSSLTRLTNTSMEVFKLLWRQGPITRVGFMTTSLNGAVSAISQAALPTQYPSSAISNHNENLQPLAATWLASLGN